MEQKVAAVLSHARNRIDGPLFPFPRMRRVSPAHAACHLFLVGHLTQFRHWAGADRATFHSMPRLVARLPQSPRTHLLSFFFFCLSPFFSEFYTVCRIILHGH